MPDTTTTGAFQQRITQAVAADFDESAAADVGQGDAQDAMDVLTDQGYFGHVPEESS